MKKNSHVLTGIRLNCIRLNWGWLICIGPALAILMIAGVCVCAAESPTGRRSTDREADLIDALVDEGMAKEAEAICERSITAAERGLPNHAMWSIRLSAVRAAILREQASEDPDAWQRAGEPVRSLLQSYGNEPFAEWLRLQSLLVELSHGEVLAMRSMANPNDADRLSAAEQVVRKTTSGLRELAEQLEQPLIGGSSPNPSETDRIKLRSLVRRRIVDSLLVRARLYATDSNDALAAATEAERAAEQLLEATGFDSPNRESVVRTLARARREAQNPKAAAELLGPWVLENRISEPATLAEWLQAEMQRGNNDLVRQTLTRYFGATPEVAPKSVDMDMARLRFLINELERSQSTNQSTGNRDEIIRWVAAIGQRSGPFARRMAETEMLRVLKNRPSEGNATLMVAQAGELIRSGVPDSLVEAAGLLQQASRIAASSGNNADSFRYGVQAAAAFTKAGQTDSAAAQFASVAREHPTQPQSPALHFESARMLSVLAASADTQTVPALTDRIEQTLLAQIQAWPNAEQSASARAWLVRIYESGKRWNDAARLAINLPADSILWDEAVANAGRYYRAAVEGEPSIEARSEIGRVAVSAWNQLLDKATASVKGDLSGTMADPVIRIAIVCESNMIAALTLDAAELPNAWKQPAGQVNDIGEFADDLRRVRAESIDPQRVALQIPRTPDSQRIADLVLSRLRADGEANASLQTIAGRAMLRIVETRAPEDLQGQVSVAMALAWTGEWAAAATRFEALASAVQRETPAGLRGSDILSLGAKVLGENRDPNAKKRALEFWNRLASGLKPGSAPWHEAKLGAAGLMIDLGQKEDAAKLARYVLLTQPPADQQLKGRYQSVAGQSP